MKVAYSATFEFDEAPPVTVRGEVEASSLPTLCARAARDAKAQRPQMMWSSFVVVLDKHGFKSKESREPSDT